VNVRPAWAWVLAAGALALSPNVAAAQDKWTPELALRVKNVGGVAVSPDAQRIAFQVGVAVMDGDKSEWLTHIHVARADGSGSFRAGVGRRADQARP